MSIRNGSHSNTQKALCIVPIGAIAKHMIICKTLKHLLEKDPDNQIVLIGSRTKLQHQSATLIHHQIQHVKSPLFGEENLYLQVMGALATMYNQNKQITFVVSNLQSALLRWIVKHVSKKNPGKDIKIYVVEVETTLRKRLWNKVEYLLDVSRGFPVYVVKHQ